MYPSYIRRKHLLRLLAQLDQQIAEVVTMMAEPVLTLRERQVATAQLDSRRNLLKRVEKLLAQVV